MFDAGGVRSFVLESGSGEAVVCLHGVPSSSFLYRKLLPELAREGLKGIAFDFPGLGLAERPDNFDYSWTGLADWTGEAIDALGIDRCHLVVHDIGGPIGIEWASRNPDRVLSLTILNAPVRVADFRRPWPMHPFSIARIGELWLALMRRPFWVPLFRLVGLQHQNAMTNAEINAYIDVLKRNDGGKAFLKIMRGFELTEQKQDLLLRALRRLAAPIQIIWGQNDTMLGRDRMQQAVDAVGATQAELLPGKHFLQEDNAHALAAKIALLARSQRN
ncbi:alpha/beta fold hydrolase [Subtercola lobariae]|nr:alpha/beta fold hydrolase [Subtercola lobariae]